MRSREHGLYRLGGLKEINEETEKDMQALADRFGDLQGKKPVVVSSFNLFPTPPAIARKMIDWAEINTKHRILEPSAGTGNLIRALYERPFEDVPFGESITMVEIEPRLCSALKAEFPCSKVRCEDFLQWNGAMTSPSLLFDRIIMNPPFKNGVDRKHIDHALRMLAPGGILVTLMANGPRQRDWFDRTSRLDCYPDACWRDLPSGSFKCEGTNVDVGMIRISKS